MDIFSLQIQVVGQTHHATATSDGTGITLSTIGAPVAAASVREAERAAQNYLGPFLHDADRRKLPWGLYVSVGGVAAVYGTWPLLPSGRPSNDPSRDEFVTRIRREFRDGSALAALENAIRIIEAYTPQRRAA